MPEPDATDELARKLAALRADSDGHGGRTSPDKLASGRTSPWKPPSGRLSPEKLARGRLSPTKPPSGRTSPAKPPLPARSPHTAPPTLPIPSPHGTPRPPAPQRQLPRPLSVGGELPAGAPSGVRPRVPAGECLAVDELWPLLFPGFDTQRDADGGTLLVKRAALRILLVDVRPRPMYEAGHLRGAECVCIDPALLRTPPVSAAELAASLGGEEAACFAARGTYDLLVLYDEQTRAFGAPGSRTPEQVCLDAVVRAVQPDIPHAPALLRGGYTSWARAVGERGVVASPHAQRDMLEAVRQSRLDGYRVPGSDVVSRPPRAYHAPTTREIPPSLQTGGAGARGPTAYAPEVHGAVLAPPPRAAAPAGSVHRLPAARAPEARADVLRDVRVGMSGLRNFGNTCYMNATLQCLSATVVLARYMLDGTFKRAVNVHNPLGTRGALAEAFAQLLRALWSQQYAALAPHAFREQIARFAPAFASSDQQDSQEFLTFLLDGLHEDLNLVQQRPPAIELGEAQQAELDRLPPQLASVAEWSMYRRRNDSVIVDAFQGQLRNQLRCLTCGHTSTTYNAFLSLSLPVAHARGVHTTTLLQCVDLFVREEILEKSNAWNCPRCKKARRATKKLSLSRLPPILVVHLKRFTYKGPVTNKIDTPVHFPTTALDLSNYMPPPLPPGTAVQGIPASESQRPPYLYDLYAVTHHFGTLTSGHYTASIKNQNTWFYCDDTRITPDDPARLQSASPYVLFFRRRPRSSC